MIRRQLPGGRDRLFQYKDVHYSRLSTNYFLT